MSMGALNDDQSLSFRDRWQQYVQASFSTIFFQSGNAADHQPRGWRRTSSTTTAPQPGALRWAPPSSPNCTTRPGSSISSNPAMTAKKWSKLPKLLVERVLSRLPTAEFIRLRTVCRWWNSLPEQRSFRRMSSKMPSSNGSPWFMFNKTSGIVLDAAAHKGMHLPLPVAAKSVLCWPVASDGGLVLYYNGKYRTFAVGNPILPLARYELPPMRSIKCFEAAGLVVTTTRRDRKCCSSGAYKVVVVGKNGELKSSITEVFDSVFWTWTRCGGVVAPQCRPSHDATLVAFNADLKMRFLTLLRGSSEA